MSSPAPSDISQNDAEVLEKQQQEMQRRHEEQQQLLAQLEEAARLHQAECTAQKARREVEEKAWEEAECYSTRVWTDFGLGLGLGP